MPWWQALQVSGRFCGCSLLFASPGEITPAWAFFWSLIFGSPPWHLSQPTAFSLCVDMCHSAYRLVRRSGEDSLAWQFTQLLSRNSTRASCGVNNLAVAPAPPAILIKVNKAPTDSFFSIVASVRTNGLVAEAGSTALLMRNCVIFSRCSEIFPAGCG